MPVRKLAATFALLGLTVAACEAVPPGQSAVAPASILVSSSPAAGSVVSAPDQLVLEFSPPARLLEVVVKGPEGEMPAMVTAVGETRRYSLPMPSDAPGSYSVAWRASVGASEHRGSFGFTIR